MQKFNYLKNKKLVFILTGVTAVVLGVVANQYFESKREWATDLHDIKFSVERVHIKGKSRMDSLVFSVKNTGDKPARLKASMADLEIFRDGNFFNVFELREKEPSLNIPHLQFAPSRIRLDPGASQSIKIVYQTVPELTRSRHRTVLNFCIAPNNQAMDQVCRVGNEMTLRAVPIFVELSYK